jgi:hypothetical protein
VAPPHTTGSQERQVPERRVVVPTPQATNQTNTLPTTEHSAKMDKKKKRQTQRNKCSTTTNEINPYSLMETSEYLKEIDILISKQLPIFYKITQIHNIKSEQSIC